MSIKPNSTLSEAKSPYFKRNERFCVEFENYIHKKNGKTKGYFNAWSYCVIGKIIEPNIWILEYKKSTFTSGNLFLTSKFQNLSHSVKWKTKNRFGSNFSIKRISLGDIFNLGFKKSVSRLDFSEKYLIEKNEENSPKFIKLIEILKPLITTCELYKVENSNDVLKIELKTENHYFDIFDKLTEI